MQAVINLNLKLSLPQKILSGEIGLELERGEIKFAVSGHDLYSNDGAEMVLFNSESEVVRLNKETRPDQLKDPEKAGMLILSSLLKGPLSGPLYQLLNYEGALSGGSPAAHLGKMVELVHEHLGAEAHVEVTKKGNLELSVEQEGWFKSFPVEAKA